MKNIQRILPFVAVVGVLAAAITYVLSSQPARPTDPVPVAKASVVLVNVTLPRGTQPWVVPSSQPFETIVWAVARAGTASCTSMMTPTAHAQVHHRCRVAKVLMKAPFPGGKMREMSRTVLEAAILLLIPPRTTRT